MSALVYSYAHPERATALEVYAPDGDDEIEIATERYDTGHYCFLPRNEAQRLYEALGKALATE